MQPRHQYMSDMNVGPKQQKMYALQNLQHFMNHAKKYMQRKSCLLMMWAEKVCINLYQMKVLVHFCKATPSYQMKHTCHLGVSQLCSGNTILYHEFLFSDPLLYIPGLSVHCTVMISITAWSYMNQRKSV